jgi:hypothetical protein
VCYVWWLGRSEELIERVDGLDIWSIRQGQALGSGAALDSCLATKAADASPNPAIILTSAWKFFAALFTVACGELGRALLAAGE